MEQPDSQVIFIVKPPPKLGRAKRGDICRIAQRMIDQEGCLKPMDVFQRCRPRIPGSGLQYSYTFGSLVRSGELKPRSRRAS